MDILSGLNITDGVLITIICASLCIVGIIGLFAIQLLTGALQFLVGFVEIFFGILQGGPLAWCGCLVLLFGCGICSIITFSFVSVIPQCSTPQAVNLCRFLGY